MRIQFSACKKARPLQVNFPGGLNMDQFIPVRRRKDKVVIVMGATGTGKSRLSIDLAAHFEAEIVNSDKMQVYKGLDIVTNKVTDEECRGIPRHLLGIVDPDADFSQVNFPGGLNMDQFIPVRRRKNKVVIVMGATGTGKSRLSIDLAAHFQAEIVNSDKMQVYKGLDIVTNKVTEEECRGIPHHLLGIVDPDADFSAVDFVHHASTAIDSITRRGKLPIIAGGSNSYIKALVNDDMEFQSKYECCFLWVDVSMPVLHSFVSKRVDQMVDASLIDEAREFFDPGGNYTRGIKRAIGVPELHEFFRNESILDYETRARLLKDAIDKIKTNTCKLACKQLQNIVRLRDQLESHMHYLDATEVFVKRDLESVEAWEMLVARPATTNVDRFLCEDDMNFMQQLPCHLYSIKSLKQLKPF